MEAGSRNYGIDLLRIVAMFSIVILHLIKHGGILSNAVGIQFYVVWLLQAIVICSVDCFALISGYVGYSDVSISNIKFGKALKLWLQVCFFSVVLYTIISLTEGGGSTKEFMKACLPITTNQYWYFTAYAGVFIAGPWINRFISTLSEAELKQLVGIVVSVCIVYIPFVGILYDPFGVMGGYSALWLVILYIIGALIKKTNFPARFSKRKLIFLAFCCISISYIAKITVPSQNIFIAYTSPTTLVFSICMIALFSKLNVNVKIRKAIVLVASTTFGIYLVHDNNMVRKHFITNKFVWILNYPPGVVIGIIIACAVGIFVLAALMDLARQKLFYIVMKTKRLD